MTTGMILYSFNVFMVGLNVGSCFFRATRDGRVGWLPLSALMVTTLAAFLTYPWARREVRP